MGIRKNKVMKVQIRPAGKEDIAFIAWVLLTAHRGHLERGLWDFMVGGDEQQCLGYLQGLTSTDQLHWAHFSTFLVAEVDHQPAAALSGYFAPQLGEEAFVKGLFEANRKIGRSKEEHKASFQRYGSILHVAPEHANGTWVVENVATRPEFRRRGLVDQLLAKILEKGRDLGARTTDISVLIGNDPAQCAYEKNGFQVAGEKRHPDFEKTYGTPGIRALSREL